VKLTAPIHAQTATAVKKIGGFIVVSYSARHKPTVKVVLPRSIGPVPYRGGYGPLRPTDRLTRAWCPRQLTAMTFHPVRRVGWIFLNSSLFNNKPSAKHAHWAGEGELARVLRQKLDRNGFAGGELSALIEIGEDHFV
jgi:hypothetical protein